MRILEMPEKESGALLAVLKAHAVERNFGHTHKSRVGNLLMWNNCAIQHKAVPNALPQRRLMERKTLLSAAAIGMLAEHYRQQWA